MVLDEVAVENALLSVFAASDVVVRVRDVTVGRESGTCGCEIGGAGERQSLRSTTRSVALEFSNSMIPPFNFAPCLFFSEPPEAGPQNRKFSPPPHAFLTSGLMSHTGSTELASSGVGVALRYHFPRDLAAPAYVRRHSAISIDSVFSSTVLVVVEELVVDRSATVSGVGFAARSGSTRGSPPRPLPNATMTPLSRRVAPRVRRRRP